MPTSFSRLLPVLGIAHSPQSLSESLSLSVGANTATSSQQLFFDAVSLTVDNGLLTLGGFDFTASISLAVDNGLVSFGNADFASAITLSTAEATTIAGGLALDGAIALTVASLASAQGEIVVAADEGDFTVIVDATIRPLNVVISGTVDSQPATITGRIIQASSTQVVLSSVSIIKGTINE